MTISVWRLTLDQVESALNSRRRMAEGLRRFGLHASADHWNVDIVRLEERRRALMAWRDREAKE